MALLSGDKPIPLVLLLASLGLLVFLESVIALLFHDDVLMMPGTNVKEGFTVLGARLTAIQLCIAVTGLSVILALAGMLHFTRVGNRIRAVASNPQLACTVGIRTDLVISGVFVLANVMVVLAGILMACDTGLTPSMGFRPFMLGVVAAILGGVGSTMGSLVAGLFIGLAQNIAVLWVPTQWQDAIVFLILVAFLLLRPAGLLGKQPTGVIATV